MPPPMTSSRFGTCANLSAPVEETILSSSMVMPGRLIGTEPVAIRMFLVSIVVGAPLSGVTSTRPAAGMEPVPRKVVILFFLNRNSMPPTLAVTVSSLCVSICLRFSFGATSIPNWENWWPASSNSSEACSSALEGMQPMLRQVPPKVGHFSTTATFMPSCAARIAAT